MKINVKKLSELAGVSPATVSNALNHKRGVNPETARQILELAAQYGYEPTEKIHCIRIVRYFDSGEIVTDVPFFNDLLATIEELSRRNGYETKLVNLYRHREDYEDCVKELLRDASSAVLFLGTELRREDARAFLGAKMPFLLVDTHFDDLPFHTVLMHNESPVYHSVNLLIEKGHTKIGYLRSAARSQNFSRRYRGFVRAMSEAGLTVEADFCYELPPTLVGAHDSFAAALEEKRELPTAFVAGNDMIALGAMKALQERGIAVPQDISLIGFDDIAFGAVSSPSLTTVHLDNRAMGETAVKRLLELIRDPDQAPVSIELYTSLIERDSVAAAYKQPVREKERI